MLMFGLRANVCNDVRFNVSRLTEVTATSLSQGNNRFGVAAIRVDTSLPHSLLRSAAPPRPCAGGYSSCG